MPTPWIFTSLRRADEPTTGVDDLLFTPGDDLVDVDAPELNPGDSFDGDAGTDTLLLTGGGSFDFTGVSLPRFEEIRTDGTDVEITFDKVKQAKMLVEASGAHDVVHLSAGGARLFDKLFDAGVEEIKGTSSFFFDPGPFDFTFTSGGADIVHFEGVDVSPGNTSPIATISGNIDTKFDYTDIVTTYDDGVVETLLFDDRSGVPSQIIIEDGAGDVLPYVRKTLNTDRFGIESRIVERDDGDVVTTTYSNGGIAQTKVRVHPDGSVDAAILSKKSHDLTGTAFGDRLVGNDNVNALVAGGGSDTLIGGGAADTFDCAGGGNDKIRDFAVAEDILSMAGVTGLADVTVVEVTDAIVLENALGDRVRLDGLTAADAASIVFA